MSLLNKLKSYIDANKNKADFQSWVYSQNADWFRQFMVTFAAEHLTIDEKKQLTGIFITHDTFGDVFTDILDTLDDEDIYLISRGKYAWAIEEDDHRAINLIQNAVLNYYNNHIAFSIEVNDE